MLSLYKLEIFDVVAAEGSFSRAAEKMHLTQPAISQHIRDLEASLRTELFVRDHRGVQLTAAGETLLDYTRCILRLVSEAESAVTQLEALSEGQLSIGATPGVGVYLLPAWIQSFHQRFPDLQVALHTATTNEVASGVGSARFDLGFIEGELQVDLPLNALVLREIALYMVVGQGHRWWDKEQVEIAALQGEPFLIRPEGSHTRAWIDQLLEHYGVQPHLVAEFDNPEAIRQAVASGMGVTILPEWGLSEGSLGGRLRALPIREVDLRRTLKLVWNEDQPLKAAGRAFLAHLTDQFPQLTQLVASGKELQLVLPNREEYRASLGCAKSKG
jgi:DNA-binding transcriptional LysR family regulator